MVYIGFDNLVLKFDQPDVQKEKYFLAILLGILIPAVISSVVISAFFLKRVRENYDKSKNKKLFNFENIEMKNTIKF